MPPPARSSTRTWLRQSSSCSVAQRRPASRSPTCGNTLRAESSGWSTRPRTTWPRRTACRRRGPVRRATRSEQVCGGGEGCEPRCSQHTSTVLALHPLIWRVLVILARELLILLAARSGAVRTQIAHSGGAPLVHIDAPFVHTCVPL